MLCHNEKWWYKKLMKKLFFVIFIFCSSNVLALELKPLTDVINKLDTSDDVTKIYVYSRCSGLYGALWDSLLSNNKKEMADIMLKQQQKLAIYATMLDMKLNDRTADESAKKQKNNIQTIKDIYVEMFNKNWFENGAYFQGTWIEGDVQICGPIVEGLPSI